MLYQISLCSLHKLIRDDTFYFYVSFNWISILGGKCCLWGACANCTGRSGKTLWTHTLRPVFPESTHINVNALPPLCNSVRRDWWATDPGWVPCTTTLWDSKNSQIHFIWLLSHCYSVRRDQWATRQGSAPCTTTLWATTRSFRGTGSYHRPGLALLEEVKVWLNRFFWGVKFCSATFQISKSLYFL